MNNLKEDLSALIMKLDAVTELFYQQKIAEAYQGMEFLLDSMDNVLQNIIKYKQEHPDAEIDQMLLIGSLGEAMKAMEAKDTVLLADILAYELKETFEAIKKQL